MIFSYLNRTSMLVHMCHKRISRTRGDPPTNKYFLIKMRMQSTAGVCASTVTNQCVTGLAYVNISRSSDALSSLMLNGLVNSQPHWVPRCRPQGKQLLTRRHCVLVVGMRLKQLPGAETMRHSISQTVKCSPATVRFVTSGSQNLAR